VQAVALEAYQSVTRDFVWPALLHSLWIGLGSASLFALLLQFRPRLSHRTRYAACLTGLVLAIAGPLAATIIQHSIASRPTRVSSSHPIVTIGGVSESLEPDVQPESLTPDFPSRELRPARPGRAALATAWVSDVSQRLRQLRSVVVSVWLAGVLLCAGALAVGSAALNRMRREAKPASPRIVRKASVLARRMKFRRAPRVLVHRRALEPFVCGLLRPAILLPEPWLAASRDDLLESILAHELAHAHRFDHVVNVAQRLIEAMLFFHPAVHWLSRSLRRHREFCADQLAVRLTGDPLALASALESVALLQFTSRKWFAGETSLGGQTASLLPRIEELIGMTPSQSRQGHWPFVALPAAALIALVAASAGSAQDRPIAAPDSTVKETSPVSTEAALAPEDRLKVTVTPGTNTPVATSRQISYDVRFLSLDAEPWREKLAQRLELIQQDADVSAWKIDEAELQELLKTALAEVSANVLHAPKVTAFEGDSATIRNRDRIFYVSGIEREKSGDPADFSVKPIVKSVEEGYEITLAGKYTDAGAQFSVDLRDSSLLVLRTLIRRERSRDQDYAISYQVPTMIERKCRSQFQVLDGSGVLISLGLGERHRTLPRAVGAASRVLESAGLPHFEPKSVTTERLVVVIPRRIVLEEEEKPIGSEVDFAFPIKR
jgi:beta-lactamase regulating signal transducer with metallopeptidase domain